MQGILAVTFWHSAMAASGGSKVTYGAMKCALSKARGGRVQFHFCFGVEKSNLKSILTLLDPAFFGSLKPRGGADLPPPSKNGGNGWEVPKLSWNLISYQDWCQTKGFSTFRYLEPPQLMVWKSDFFPGSMRFVRVPPYESWANLTNFFSSWENGDFFWGQKCCTLFHTQNEEK